VTQEHEHSQDEKSGLCTNGSTVERIAKSATLAVDDDPVLTPKEAAQYLRISVASLLRHTRTGEIKAFHVGKLWRYRKSWLDEYARSSVSFFRHPCRE
jgi:excisionase family DNA binding protein